MARRICCPVPTYIESAVTSVTGCAQDVGQIQKMFFWRRDNYATTASAATSTYWSTALTATGDSKVVVSPFCGNVEFEPGEPREFGGGNETKDGIPIVKGSEATMVTGRFYQEDQDIIDTMKDWSCEKLDVFFVNESNQFVYDDRGGEDFYGFPLESLNIKDLKIGGFTDADYNDFSMRLRPDWSDSLEVADATTFALDLVNS